MKSVFIIAEAGVNHNGDVALAKRLVEEAKKAGADAVKFQTFKAENLVTVDAPQAEYQTKNLGQGGSQFAMLKKLELSENDFRELSRYSAKIGIEFMSTPFDEESADFLDSLGMKRFKIPSGEITNIPLLEHIARKGKPIILSTGMSSLEEVRDAVKSMQSAGNSQITLLHCTSSYPAPKDQVNLRAMETLTKEIGMPVGYSDHTEGIEIAIAAVALGAVATEKHFTLDRNMEGPDHKASLEPHELAEMVRGIRNVCHALGDGIKRVTQVELNVRDAARKSVVAARSIPAGKIVAEEDLTAKRPGTGLPPKHRSTVIGKKARRQLAKDQVVVWDDFE